MKQLTFNCGDQNLFNHPIFGAYTKVQIKELEAVHSKPKASAKSVNYMHVECSEEQSIMNEHFIDEHGFSMF